MNILRLSDGLLTSQPAGKMAFDLACQVLCVGAGSAGVYAADAAAQMGASVILVEQDVTLGGMHLLGNVRGCYYGFHGGSFEEDQPPREDAALQIKTDRKKISLLERLRRSGVAQLYSCTPTALLVDGSSVVGLLAFDGEKELAISAEMVIDATSDGFLIRMLPVKKEYGRPKDGKMAPYSVIATLWQQDRIRHVNRDAGYIDPYDCDDFTHKALMAHAQAADLMGRGSFLNLATHTGVREGLRFEGEQTLRYEDVLYGRKPDKLLFWAYSDLDLHGSLRALDEEIFQTWWVLCNMATAALRIPVPMGAVVPKGWRGIVTAGRCLSADSYIGSAVRMNRDCFRMGQCVGTAAAMAKAGDLLAVDYDAYVQKVQQLECFFGDESKVLGFDSPHGDILYRPISLNWRQNLPLLSTNTPAPLFWSAFRCEEKDDLTERLLDMLRGETEILTRYNIGLTLGILGRTEALPLLRQIVQNRDDFSYADCRRSNQFRSVMAVCLLGRLGERGDEPVLKQIAFDACEFDRPMYRTGKGLYFQMVTHSGAALLRLYQRHGLSLAELNCEFARLMDEGLLVERIAPGCGMENVSFAETVDFLKEMIHATKDKEGKCVL